MMVSPGWTAQNFSHTPSLLGNSSISPVINKIKIRNKKEKKGQNV